METFTLPDAAAAARRIQSDAPHRIGIGIYVAADAFVDPDAGDSNGEDAAQRVAATWAVAIVEASTGRALAWDGWYPDQLDGPTRRRVSDLPWDDYDDMPSKLLLRCNQPWLGGPFATLIFPEYDLATYAGEEVLAHGDVNERGARPGPGSALVAYFPVVNGKGVLAVIEAHRNQSIASFGDERAERLAAVVETALGED